MPKTKIRAVGSEHIKKYLMYDIRIGLGLSLSYNIVTEVGELKVETNVGEGTVFIISILKS
jgi:K+-sensing histidine kinase KdpD